MTTLPTPASTGPQEIGHIHQDVSGGWLRAAVFGAMDGLVTNISLVAGIGAAGAGPEIVLVTGTAGLVAGAFSMALGEYASVQTQNEQVDHEWAVEREEIVSNPAGEEAELSQMFSAMGMTRQTADQAAAEVHRDQEAAVLLHVTSELGLDPREKPSPRLAAISSFIMFSIGAFIPLIPYVLGFDSLRLALLVGSLGLLVAGAVAATFTSRHWVVGGLRQLLYGAIAAGATYLVGLAMGVSATG